MTTAPGPLTAHTPARRHARATDPMKRAITYLKILSVVAVCLAVLPSLAVAANDTDLQSTLAQLPHGSFSEKERTVDALAQIDDPRVLKILRALLNGDLYYRKSDKLVVFVHETPDGDYALTDVLSGDDLGKSGRRKVKKIGINNNLRGALRGNIARLSLSSKDPSVRKAAVEEMLSDADPETVSLLQPLYDKETDEGVRKAMATALALGNIDANAKDARLAAIDELAGSLYPEVRAKLLPLVARSSDGNYQEPDAQIRDAAAVALRKIDNKLTAYHFVETTFFGLSLGSVLLLIAIGLAITFGVMGVINMAHGELMMLGAYTTYLVQVMMPNHIDLSLLVAIPAAFLVSGAVGIAIERGVIRFLYGRPLETLLATFGISLVLQQFVRTAISAQNVTVSNPSWLSGSLQINPALAVTYNRLYIIVFSLLVFAFLLLILKKTALGLYVRAVSQNRTMARAMGVRSDWIDALTFGLGSGVAGVAGVALSQLTNVGPNLGQSYIIDSFMVVVFGGVGNLWGTLVGALSLGVVNKYLEPWTGAVLAKIFVLVFIILFIQKRPRGLFPQKGRAAEG
jgi:urea transport system permease protein